MWISTQKRLESFSRMWEPTSMSGNMEVPILDKGIDDWGNDEQEEAYDKLQQLKQEFEGTPTKLYINNNEELQSYMMWFARMDGLPYEMTDGETRVC